MFVEQNEMHMFHWPLLHYLGSAHARRTLSTQQCSTPAKAKVQEPYRLSFEGFSKEEPNTTGPFEEPYRLSFEYSSFGPFYRSLNRAPPTPGDARPVGSEFQGVEDPRGAAQARRGSRRGASGSPHGHPHAVELRAVFGTGQMDLGKLGAHVV